MMMTEMANIVKLEQGGEDIKNNEPLSGESAVMAAKMMLPRGKKHG